MARRRRAGSDSPALDMPFLSGVLDPRIAFTRASTATYFNATGTMQTASADQPRFDYDPITLAARGLLIEQVSTNFIPNSTMQGAAVGVLPTGWGVTASGMSIVGTGTEFGMAYVDVRMQNTNPASDSWAQVVFTATLATRPTAATGEVWTASFYYKTLAGAWPTGAQGGVQCFMQEETSAGGYLTTGATLLANSAVPSRAANTRTLTNASVGKVSSGVQLYTRAGQSIDVTIRLYAPQLENREAASSFIPTAGAAGSRATDSAVITGASFSSWYNQAAGTFVSAFDSAVVTQTYAGILNASDGTPANRIYHYMNKPSGAVGLQTKVAGTATGGTMTLNALQANVAAKSAFSYDTATLRVALNGGALGGGTPSAMPAANQLTIGGGDSFLNGHFRRLTYYPAALSAARLQALGSGPIDWRVRI